MKFSAELKMHIFVLIVVMLVIGLQFDQMGEIETLKHTISDKVIDNAKMLSRIQALEKGVCPYDPTQANCY